MSSYEKLSDEEHYARHLNPIFEMIENNKAVPWSKPWRVGNEAPRNLISNREYTGFTNILVLALSPYSSPFWVTKAKCEEHGGQIKPGEEDKGTYVFYWHRHKYSHTDTDTGEVRSGTSFYPRTHLVWNVEQTEGIIHHRLVKPDPIEHEPMPEFDEFVKSYCSGTGPKIKFGGSRAFYRPSNDTIEVPEDGEFESFAHHAHTTFHEMGHSTGHQKRLNRRGITEVNSKTQDMYAREELVAELAATLLMSKFGFTEEDLQSTVDNSVSYVQSWAKSIKDDPKMLVIAGRSAEKAVNYIMDHVGNA